MKQFKGRVITPGEVTAEAVVTTQGFNTLASLQMPLQFAQLMIMRREKRFRPDFFFVLAGFSIILS